MNLLALSATEVLNTADEIASVIGAFSAVIAIFLALRAQRTADRAIAEERRRVFELEILRDLMLEFENPDFAYNIFRVPASVANFEPRLSLLSDRPPFWDQIASLTTRDEVIKAVGLGEEHRGAAERNTKIIQDREAAVEVHGKAQNEMMWPAADEKRSRELRAQLVVDAQVEMQRLLKLEGEVDVRRQEIEQDAYQKLRKLLIRDVQDLITSRVEARRKRPIEWIEQKAVKK